MSILCINGPCVSLITATTMNELTKQKKIQESHCCYVSMGGWHIVHTQKNYYDLNIFIRVTCPQIYIKSRTTNKNGSALYLKIGDLCVYIALKNITLRQNPGNDPGNVNLANSDACKLEGSGQLIRKFLG